MNTIARRGSVALVLLCLLGAAPSSGEERATDTLIPPPTLGAPPPIMDGCGACVETACCEPLWTHRSNVFGEYLFIRSRDSRVVYGEVIDGAITPPDGVAPIPFDTLDLVDQDYSSSYRFGATLAIDCNSSIVATYTRFETSTDDTGLAETPLVLRSTVLHPGTLNAAADFLDAAAAYSLDYDIVDIDCRNVLRACDMYAINGVFGARYLRQNQDFASLFSGTGIEEGVLTSIDFDGAGLRAGLDAERYGWGGFMFYAKGMANFLAGDFRGRYQQGSATDPEIVDIDWEEGRIISILEMEMGFGWTSCTGRVRASAGYMMAAWFNTIKTDEFIQAVRANDFVDLTGTMTFDGLTARVEVAY